MREYIKSDLFRYTGKTTLLSFVREFLIGRAFRHQVFIRMANASGFVGKVGKILYYINRYFCPGLQISYRCKIGYGLYIGHGGPIVVSRFVTIGNNCNLSQFTTIGTNENLGAVIGDNVYIGPNSCLIDDVTIGDNVTIGAGSVVTKDIPNDATAAGNPARVINYNSPGKYIHNKWT